MTQKEIHLNLFAFGAGHHAAAWRAVEGSVEKLGLISWWEELARTAERGKLDAVFLADGQAINPVGLENGPGWFLEPVTALTAMARATNNIGLISTISSTFWQPFHAARMIASLDHISGGRAGINVVTSMTDAEARNHGMDALPGHDVRYARAAEFIETITALWDSWPAESLVMDRAGKFVDSSLIKSIDHDGEFFQVAGPLNIPSPPQGRPVIFQAGSSPQGREIAAKYAEAIYSVAWDLEQAQDYRSDIHARATAQGREPMPVLPGLVTFVGTTVEEARAKQQALNALLPVKDSLNQLSFFMGQDCSTWDLDAPPPPLPPLEEFSGPKGRYETVLRIIESKSPTVRELLGYLAAGGGHATFIGTPESIADEIERWIDEGGADGFNLMPPMLPHSLDDFVDLVVPELQRRGRFRTEYSHTTLRGHLFNQVTYSTKSLV